MRNLLFTNAKIRSKKSMNINVAISLLAVVKGLFVAISSPAKKVCEIPIYRIGSIISIYSICESKIIIKEEFFLLLGFRNRRISSLE